MLIGRRQRGCSGPQPAQRRRRAQRQAERAEAHRRWGWGAASRRAASRRAPASARPARGFAASGERAGRGALSTCLQPVVGSPASQAPVALQQAGAPLRRSAAAASARAAGAAGRLYPWFQPITGPKSPLTRSRLDSNSALMALARMYHCRRSPLQSRQVFSACRYRCMMRCLWAILASPRPRGPQIRRQMQVTPDLFCVWNKQKTPQSFTQFTPLLLVRYHDAPTLCGALEAAVGAPLTADGVVPCIPPHPDAKVAQQLGNQVHRAAARRTGPVGAPRATLSTAQRSSSSSSGAAQPWMRR